MWKRKELLLTYMLKGCYYEDRLLLDNCLEDTGIKDLWRRSDGSIKRDAERGASLGLLIKSLFIRWISVGFVSTTITIATCWEGLMQLRVSRSSFQTWNCLDHLEMYVRTFIVFFKAIHFNHKYNHRSAQIFCCSKTQWCSDSALPLLHIWIWLSLGFHPQPLID